MTTETGIMADKPHKIMLVEGDPEILEMLVSALSARLDAQLTCVSSAESGLEADIADPHDLVIIELELDDGSGIELAERLCMLAPRPIILLADELTTQDTIAAMRLGVSDLLMKPFPLTELLDAAGEALRRHDVHQAHLAKYRRMRALVRRVLRERRAMHQRMELVCQDLVAAHRRLMHRVLALEDSRRPA